MSTLGKWSNRREVKWASKGRWNYPELSI